MDRTNAQRQKRWRDKHRALFNLRRRNLRKKNLSGGVESRHAVQPSIGKEVNRGVHPATDQASGVLTDEPIVRSESVGIRSGTDSGSSDPPAQPFETKKVGEFRMVMLPESTKSVVVDSKPSIFRDDYGRVITERTWNILQEKKRKAEKGGYFLDDYSQ